MILSRCVLASLLALPTASHTAGAWDVENTGEPFVEVSFTVTEGTWMSVDVSPDGSKLAFDLLGDIYMLPAGGGDATVVHGGPAMQRDPKFSPDGRSLLFISDRDGGDNLWISAIDGTGARQITGETVNSLTGPSWGARGEFVAAAKLFSSNDRLHTSELRLFDLTGGAGRVLVPVPANDENVHEAQFSSDGRHFYCVEKITSPTRSVIGRHVPGLTRRTAAWARPARRLPPAARPPSS